MGKVVGELNSRIDPVALALPPSYLTINSDLV